MREPDQAAESSVTEPCPIGVATLVPQTDLPETPSCTEGETLKAKSEGFQEDHYGVVAQEGTPFSAWKPPVEVC